MNTPERQSVVLNPKTLKMGEEGFRSRESSKAGADSIVWITAKLVQDRVYEIVWT
jgi:hypothetical protein